MPELEDYRGLDDVFTAVTGINTVNANLTGAGIDQPERVEVLLATPDYFEVLGGRPPHGRLFQPTDDAPGIARGGRAQPWSLAAALRRAA